jgi:hypothetical protein
MLRRRILRAFVLVASLALLAAVLGVWARSYWRVDQFSRSDRRSFAVVVSVRGRLFIHTDQTNNPIREYPRAWARRTYDAGSFPEATVGWRYLGFAHERVAREGWWGRTIALPYWPLAALLAIVPLRRVARWRRLRRRRRLSLCLNCGFDLRFSPARCPECGRPVLADDAGL